MISFFSIHFSILQRKTFYSHALGTDMTGSINFLFHILGVGLVCTSLFGGWILERRMRAENDWDQKVFIGKIGKRFGLLSPFASLLLLLTGIINIFNLYDGNITQWYTEGWLVAKIILFAFLLINGAMFGPILIRRRSKIIQSIAEKTPLADAEANINILTKSITTFYLVQSLIVLIILYLSIAGGGKHSGIL
jgi:putative copper export protein